MKYIISGVILILISLWGGAVAFNFFEKASYEFATYMTAMFLFIGGTSFLMIGINSRIDN